MRRLDAVLRSSSMSWYPTDTICRFTASRAASRSMLRHRSPGEFAAAHAGVFPRAGGAYVVVCDDSVNPAINQLLRYLSHKLILLPLCHHTHHWATSAWFP